MSEKASALFPRQNLIASSKRLKNLGELLSPTVQGRRLEVPQGPAPQLEGVEAEVGEGVKEGAVGRGEEVKEHLEEWRKD